MLGVSLPFFVFLFYCRFVLFAFGLLLSFILCFPHSYFFSLPFFFCLSVDLSPFFSVSMYFGLLGCVCCACHIRYDDCMALHCLISPHKDVINVSYYVLCDHRACISPDLSRMKNRESVNTLNREASENMRISA